MVNFQNAYEDPRFTISPFWFWNDRPDGEIIREQMAIMHRIHADQPVIHARDYMDHGSLGYLDDNWFAQVGTAIETARQKGMEVWIYDENNWPSGNCDLQITKDERLREHFLQFDIVKVKKDEPFSLNLKEKDYKAVQFFGSGEDLLPLARDGIITYTPAEKGEIYAVWVGVDPYEDRAGNQSVDYLSKEAIRKFIDMTHEEYHKRFSADFGKTIKGFFMDETRFCNAFPWTWTLEEEFEARKGYALAPVLPLLWKDTDRSPLVRYDYYDVISDMFREATFKQIYDWCEERDVQTTGHFLGEETIAAQSYFNADMMRYYRDLHVPGIDQLDNGLGALNAKMCVSASHNYGRNVISSESFGASGWDITFEEMVKISNWEFQQGITLIMMHGFYYSLRDARYYDCPPSFFYQWKYWDSMPMYAKMAARMSYMVTDSVMENDVLVYHPMETFWMYFKPDLSIKTGFDRNGPKIEDERAAFIDNRYQRICNKLSDKNVHYDILNSDAAGNFQVENGKIVNVLTGVKYSVFVLPVTEMLTEEMVALLNEFLRQGGKVVSYHSDVRYVVAKNGRHGRGALDAEKLVRVESVAAVAEECLNSVEPVYEVIRGVGETTRTLDSYPDHLIDPYMHKGENVFGVGIAKHRRDGKRILQFANFNMNEEELELEVQSTTVPVISIPETGEEREADAKQVRDGVYRFTFTLPANRTYFVTCGL